MLKLYNPILAAPVSSNCKESIWKGIIPTAWKKMADAIPIPKTRRIADIAQDLRPVSLTSLLSKVC